MTLDELIYQRFSSVKCFEENLAKYAGNPAVFYQIAPDDRQKSWKGAQYPRIVYTIDMQADEERKSAGVMQVDLYCDEAKTLPEDIEPHIRECLKNLIVKPEGNSHFAFAWARTEMFDMEGTGRDRGVVTRIAGATLRFDILEYSLQTTSNPDPAQAVQRWLKELEPDCMVIGENRIESFYEPSGEHPAFYVRIQSYKTNRSTYALTWVDCIFSVHVIAPEPEMRNSWSRYLADSLQRAGEVMMLDDSPMLIFEVSVENAADYLTRGQITVKAQYSIPRLEECMHPLRKINIDKKEEH